MITIELFGQPYTFKAEPDVEQAREVADLLVREVGKVQSQQAGGVNHVAVLMLAALNIANENLELKKGCSSLRTDLSQRFSHLIRLLDSSLN